VPFVSVRRQEGFSKPLKNKPIFLSKNQAMDLSSRIGADFRAVRPG